MTAQRYIPTSLYHAQARPEEVEFEAYVENELRRQFAEYQRLAGNDSNYKMICNGPGGCGKPVTGPPAPSAFGPGHTYSVEGVAEYRITHWCEWCFDKATMLPDEDEQDTNHQRLDDELGDDRNG